jgi:hypothetical protein
MRPIVVFDPGNGMRLASACDCAPCVRLYLVMRLWKINTISSMHDLPVFLYVDGPVVVIFRRRVVIRLITSCIGARLVHVCVFTCCALGWPRCFRVLTMVLGGILRWRARKFGRRRLWLGLGRRCGCRWGLLRRGLLVIAEQWLAVSSRASAAPRM